MKRAVFFLLLLLASLHAGSRSVAQTPYELTVAPAFGLTYVAGQWLPVRVELRNNTDTSLNGAIRIPVVLPSATSDIRIPVVVPARSRVILNSFAYLPDKPLAAAAAGTSAVPVAIAEWIAADGARLARADVLGRPDTADTTALTGQSQAPGSLLLSVSGSASTESQEVFRVQRLTEFLASRVSFPLNTGECEPGSLPRHVAGYDTVRAVVFQRISPDVLDASQRQALVGYILRGGIVILPAPLGDADPTGTWLEELMPVKIIGSRKADAISTAGAEPPRLPAGNPVKLRQTVALCEALDAGGEVLLRDASYIHASMKPKGMGKVVFTSFPMDALDHEDPRTHALWREVLKLDEARVGWTSSALGVERDHILETMIGAPVPPWSRAALIACGYVGLMFLIQLLFPGARRPAAFAGGAVLAIGICGLLVGLTALRQKADGSISASRLITIDLGEAGGGVRREAIAFFGSDDSAFSLAADVSASLRPAVTSQDNPATIQPLPFIAPGAGVRSGRVDRVWEVEAPVGPEWTLRGTLQFTSAGVKLAINNETGQVLQAPVLLFNGEAYRLPNLQPGSSDAILGSRNARGDFTNTAILAGEESSLRGRILQLASSSPPETSHSVQGSGAPQVAAWLTPARSGICPPLLSYSSEPAQLRSQAMLRSPLRIIPSNPGETIAIAPEFVTMLSDAGQGVFYDDVQREWMQSIQTGHWSIGFGAPPEIGILKPIRAEISAELAAPGHTIVLRRGQCGGGALQDNPAGAVVAEWKQTVGSRTVSVDLEPDDVDARGRLWLRMSVEEAGSDSGAGVLPQWKFNSLSVGLTAKVDDGK